MNVDKLKDALKARGCSICGLADLLGMDYQQVQYRNANNAWKAREIKQAADALGLSYEEVKEIWLQ